MSENVTVGDAAAALPPISLDMAETVTVTDSVAATLPLALDVAEDVSVGDAVSATPPLALDVAENITVSDTVGAAPPLRLDVTEDVAVNDAVSAAPPLALEVAENVTVSDVVDATPPVMLEVAEDIGVNDAVSTAPSLALEVAENVTVGDSVSTAAENGANAPPRAFIELPSDSSAYPVGASIQFIGGADDPEDGTLPDSSLTWRSDVDGLLGQGVSFSRNDLSAGVHHVSMVAVDSQGAADTATVTILVDASDATGGIDTGILPSGVVGSVGGSVRIPVGIGVGATSDTVATYDARIQWDPSSLGYDTIQAGDVPQGLSVDAGRAADGILAVRGTIDVPPERSPDTLLVLTLRAPTGPAPGDTLGVDLSFSSLRSPGGADLLPDLVVHPVGLCVTGALWGDLDGNGSVGSGDAVQMLRNAVGLPLSGGTSLAFGDLDGNGIVGVGDAILSLRKAVSLPVPPTSPVGRLRVEGCALP